MRLLKDETDHLHKRSYSPSMTDCHHSKFIELETFESLRLSSFSSSFAANDKFLGIANAKANSAKRISKMPPNQNKMSDVVQPFTVVQRLHLPFVHSNLDY